MDLSRLTGQLLDARYQMVQKVGEGGMCFVYHAQDTQTGDKVAIKILHVELLKDATSKARLRREAELGTKLSHPNVCHIVRLGETPGFDYLVMPFVDGELLCDRMQRVGPVPLGRAAEYVRDMAAGLHAAHALGILHRDLKPENIMIVARPDGSEQAIVMDFSLATALGPDVQSLTATGIVVGTPEFMSPEQLRGEDLDARSDIYALAFLVYEMLTGQIPFIGKSQHEIMIARLKGESIPIRTRRPDLDIPASVEKVLMKALARDPAQRYVTAPAFADAFSRAVAKRSFLGWPVTLFSRTKSH